MERKCTLVQNNFQEGVRERKRAREILIRCLCSDGHRDGIIFLPAAAESLLFYHRFIVAP